MRLWFVLGTAAELIKVFPLIDEASRRGWDWTVIVTGQSGVNFWNQYEDFRLDRARSEVLVDTEKDLEKVTSAAAWMRRCLSSGRSRWKDLAKKNRPEFVIVHGDTLSCGVGAYFGSRLGLRVAHVEAGLRSTHWFQPFPEELTRRQVSRWARWHFAPDETAESNLKAANVRGTVVNTGGNTLADAVRWAHRLDSGMSFEFDGLVNIHRFENLNSGQRWNAIVDTLEQAAQRWRLVMVLHPQTRFKLQKDQSAENRLRQAGVLFLERLPFTGFMGFLSRSQFLISDGGSNQEETSYLGKPCLILRNATERQEGLGSTAVLSKFDRNLINDFLQNPRRFARPAKYPDRRPSDVILDTLLQQTRV